MCFNEKSLSEPRLTIWSQGKERNADSCLENKNQDNAKVCSALSVPSHCHKPTLSIIAAPYPTCSSSKMTIFVVLWVSFLQWSVFFQQSSKGLKTWRAFWHQTWDVRFRLCPGGIWSSFGSVFPQYAPLTIFWNGNVGSVTLYIARMESLFWFWFL